MTAALIVVVMPRQKIMFRLDAFLTSLTHKERMVENINLFDFTLSDDDLQEIRLLDTGHNVTGWPSDALTYKV